MEAHGVDTRMALAREWDALVMQVRELDGFVDFMRPARLVSLLPAAAGGPVAIVNVSRSRCDGLVVTTDGVDVVELRGLTMAAVTEQVDRFLQVVDRTYGNVAARRASITGARRDLGVDRRSMDLELAGVLAWCWDMIAEPILCHLGLDHGHVTGTPWPRLWWCPTGPLALLPLHAAGRHDVACRAVIDRVVSSYTPTLQALLEARDRPRSVSVVDAVVDAGVVVGLPQTPGHPDLPGVMREVEGLARRVPPAARSVLIGSDATVARVRAALAKHRWAHLSCHGDQDMTDPSRGGLLLYDGMLSVADIGVDRFRGDFAFLSACKTATSGMRLPDEAITLAAALYFTGYRQVIGTLWSVCDDSAADVADAVYAELVTDGVLWAERAAPALHHAQRAIRARTPDRLSAWASFVHIGP